MAISYSLAARPANALDKENEKKKIYPNAQYAEVIDLSHLARHIVEHGSPFTRDVIIGVLTAAVDCTREQLVAGNKVNFGDLGAFSISLRSEGVERAEDFDPYRDVKSIEVNWAPSDYFKDLKNDPKVKYEFVPTRKEMSEAKKESKAEATQAAGNTDGNPGTGGPVTPPLE